MPHVEQHARLPVPAVLLALQEVIEELELQLAPVVGVERRPVRAAVHFQPFIPGRRTDKALEVAARVQALPAPVGGGKQRYRNLREIGAALAVVRPVHLARQKLAPHVFPITDQFVFRQRFRPANQLARDAVSGAALALAVLHGLHLHVLPVLAEGADDAAVAVAVAVGVVPALPGADRGEVRRLRRRRAPLAARVVRNAVHADLAAAPFLRRRPLDAEVEVARLARIVVAQVARRAPGAARIDAHDRIALGHPFLRVDHFPVLVPVGRAGERVGVLARHDFPRGLVALLEGEPLAVRPVTQDRRMAAAVVRTEHVGPQHQAVIHLDRSVPLDFHVSMFPSPTITV